MILSCFFRIAVCYISYLLRAWECSSHCRSSSLFHQGSSWRCPPPGAVLFWAEFRIVYFHIQSTSFSLSPSLWKATAKFIVEQIPGTWHHSGHQSLDVTLL